MDELDRLKQAMRHSPVAARSEAKRAALAAAMQAYDKKTSSARQGSGLLARLKVAALAASETLTGRRTMKSTYALAGGVSLAVLTLAVMTTADLHNLNPYRLRQQELGGEVKPLPAPVKDKTDADLSTKTAANTPVPVPEAAPVEQVAAGQPAPEQVASAEPPPPPLRSDALTKQESAGVMAPAQQALGGALNRTVAAGTAAPAAPAEMKLAATKPASTVAAIADEQAPPAYHDEGRDRFAKISTNPMKVTAEEPVSTFSIDVDTSSYSFMRASLSNGALPQADAVRVEELINYFPYDYAGPESRETPFKANVTVMATPWNPATKLVSIGIKGYDIAVAERPKANLVFLIDTSGSMEEPNKLPLLINSMKLLVDGLKPDDTVAIVTYAGAAGTVLEPTRASDKGKIVAALENLSAGGSTAGAEGIRQAYQLAERNFDKSGVNRVILATDGDFNVGITEPKELKSYVTRERETGIYLSVLGFGTGNYNDELMQTLAQNGNGAAAYIDTLNEARKVLVEESSSTVFPIAQDVKLQVEFNPATVSEYRLIGYENRMLAREDFNNDKVDAGEIGSGHTVTALYEVTPAGSAAKLVDGLRYAKPAASSDSSAASQPAADAGEYGFLKIRYKLPGQPTSRLISTPIATAETADGPALHEARFAAAVAAFGQLLRGGQYTGPYSYDDVIALAQANKGDDAFGYRAEFVNLVRLAKSSAAMATPRQ